MTIQFSIPMHISGGSLTNIIVETQSIDSPIVLLSFENSDLKTRLDINKRMFIDAVPESGIQASEIAEKLYELMVDQEESLDPEVGTLFEPPPNLTNEA